MKQEQSQKKKGGGIVEGKKERGDGRVDGRWLCSRLEAGAVEVGVRILGFKLLDGPPGGGSVGNMTAGTFWHPRVEDTDHKTLAIEDERAWVALGGEWAGLLIVVVDGEFGGLDAKLIAKVGLQPGVASNCEVAGVTIIHDDKAGLAVAVETVGISQELGWDPTVDPQLAIRGVGYLNVFLPALWG